MGRPTADDWIKKLGLESHIEGGAFREIYRSEITLQQAQMPANLAGDRSLTTSIYFLFKENQFSAFHRIRSDEQWHFYSGDPLIVYEITPGGTITEHLLSNDFDGAGSFTCVIKAGNWFASCLAAGGEYALAGCTVAPGFDFVDFELASRIELLQIYPEHAALITRLTNAPNEG